MLSEGGAYQEEGVGGCELTEEELEVEEVVEQVVVVVVGRWDGSWSRL